MDLLDALWSGIQAAWSGLNSVTPGAATLIAASAAGFVALRSIHNRRQADIRSEWWNRVQYAIGLCYEDDFHKKLIGMQMLYMLGSNKPISSRLDSYEFRKPVWRHPLDRVRWEKEVRSIQQGWRWNVHPADAHFLFNVSQEIIDYSLNISPPRSGSSHSGASAPAGRTTEPVDTVKDQDRPRRTPWSGYSGARPVASMPKKLLNRARDLFGTKKG